MRMIIIYESDKNGINAFCMETGIGESKYLDHKRAFAVKGTGRHDFLVLSGRGSDRNGF